MFIPESSQLVLKLLNPLLLPTTPLPVLRVRSASLHYVKRGFMGQCTGGHVETILVPFCKDRRRLGGMLETFLLTISLPNIPDGLTCSRKSSNLPSIFSPLHQECHTLTKMSGGPSR